MSRPAAALALDVGTSSTRVALFDERGRRLPRASVRAAHRVETTADGGAWLDPEALFHEVAACLAAVGGERAASVRGMDAFWHSLMGVDGGGRPTTPLLTWADTRPADAARELRRTLDEAALQQRTGCRLHATYWPAKLRWLAQAMPDAVRRTARWLSFAEYAQWRLTGELACSLSMASGTGLLDQRSMTWDAELLDACDLKPAQLSPLVDLDHRLPGDWLPAVGDGASSNLGSGCFGPTRLAVNVGTSSAMRLVLADAAGASASSPPDSDHQPHRAIGPAPGADRSAASRNVLPGALWRYRLDRERAVVGGALSEGGNVHAWLATVARLPPPRAAEAALAGMEPDGHGLTVLPFIAGERSTGWHADARLTLSGASLGTRPIDLLRASMEAIAYRLHAVHEELRPFAPEAEVVASGAAILASPTWLQILADVLNQPVHALADREATARGTALLALHPSGPIPDSLRARRTYKPEASRHERYALGIARQRALYQRLPDLQ